MEEKYQGWANRETWALNLWLCNDEGFYNQLNEFADDCKDEAEDMTGQDKKDFIVEKLTERIKDYVENELQDFNKEHQCNDKCSGCIRSMFEDIGSLWRIEYYDIAKAWLDE